jgi:hypothetical protein
MGCIHWMVVMMDIVGRDMLWSSFWLSTPHVKNYYTEPQYMYTFASLSLASSREAQTNYTVRESPGSAGIWNALWREQRHRYHIVGGVSLSRVGEGLGKL